MVFNLKQSNHQHGEWNQQDPRITWLVVHKGEFWQCTSVYICTASTVQVYSSLVSRRWNFWTGCTCVHIGTYCKIYHIMVTYCVRRLDNYDWSLRREVHVYTGLWIIVCIYIHSTCVHWISICIYTRSTCVNWISVCMYVYNIHEVHVYTGLVSVCKQMVHLYTGLVSVCTYTVHICTLDYSLYVYTHCMCTMDQYLYVHTQYICTMD